MSAARGFAAATALLVLVNLAGVGLPGWTYLPVNLVVLLTLLMVARRAGATGADLGMGAGSLRRGVVVGLAVGFGFAAVVTVLAVVPTTSTLFEDQRAAGIGVAGLLYQTVVRIPLGTALFEEGAFRGVLTGLGRLAWGRRAGTLAPAVLFGLWHVAPALDVADGNAAAGDLATVAVVTGSVVATTVAGLVFTWLRDRAGSLAAPVIVHSMVNAAAFTAAYLVL